MNFYLLQRALVIGSQLMSDWVYPVPINVHFQWNWIPFSRIFSLENWELDVLCYVWSLHRSQRNLSISLWCCCTCAIFVSLEVVVSTSLLAVSLWLFQTCLISRDKSSLKLNELVPIYILSIDSWAVTQQSIWPKFIFGQWPRHLVCWGLTTMWVALW